MSDLNRNAHIILNSFNPTDRWLMIGRDNRMNNLTNEECFEYSFDRLSRASQSRILRLMAAPIWTFRTEFKEISSRIYHHDRGGVTASDNQEA